MLVLQSGRRCLKLWLQQLGVLLGENGPTVQPRAGVLRPIEGDSVPERRLQMRQACRSRRTLRPKQLTLPLVIGDGGNDDAAAAQKAMRNPIGDCYHFAGSLRMCQEAQGAGI